MAERVRMRRNEREAMILLYAIQMLIQNAHTTLQAMLNARTTTGWRDIRRAETSLEKMTDELFDSVPIEQLRAIHADVVNSSIQIRVKSATPPPDGVWHLETGQIATLVNYAVQSCLVCDNRTGKGCRLKKLLEELPIEITGNAISAYMACADRLEVESMEVTA